ncbi:MAG: CpsB/CapC family capsule biosynthesis tyrosine phosphatase, partial [Anaerovoracaceae bacterium]
SLELIRMAMAEGITAIVLTPHFYPERNDFATFIQKRNDAYALLKNALAEAGIEIRLYLASEVRFSPSLLDLAVEQLAIEDTGYILIEFSNSQYPAYVQEVFYALEDRGLTPIVAHVERYHHGTAFLEKLADLGALLQVNTAAMAGDRKQRKKVLELIDRDLVHLWGTDMHSIDRRPPIVKEALYLLSRKVGKSFFAQCDAGAKEILGIEEGR